MSCPYEDRLGYIASYVQGNLPESEQEIFETHYIGCDECLSTLRFVEKTSIAIHHSGESIFTPITTAPKQTWSGWLHKQKTRLSEFIESEQVRRAAPALVMYILLVAVMSGGYYLIKSYQGALSDREGGFISNSKSVNPATLAEWQHLDWSLIDTANDNPALIAKLAEVKPIYEAQNYAAAADRLARIVKQFPEVAEVHLYLGVSQFFANNKSAAIESLRRAVALNQQLVAAQWYLAQAYLIQAEPKAAKELLISITRRPDSPYAKQAAALLEKMDKLSQRN